MMDAKMTFLADVEKRLSTEITAADMSRAMAALSDVMQDYCFERTTREAGRDDLIDTYLDALTVEGRSPKTVARYRYILSRLLLAIKVPTRSVTVYHIRRFLSDEKARGISDHTLEGDRQVFSACFGWLQREDLIDKDPTANLGAVKFQKKQKDIYSQADIEKLKFACDNARDRAIVCVLAATGCRISELTQLDRADVDMTGLECKVLGKGNKERTVYLDEIAAMALQTYLSTRKDDLPALFTGHGSDRLKPGAVRLMLNKIGDRANVSHPHPHKFRRTAATNLIRRGMPIQEVAAILGHDKLDTTMQYVVLDKTDVKNSYRKYA